MEVSDARRPKELEVEDQQLKRLVAERDLAIEVMKEIQQKKR
jgi:putative transposase